MRVTSKCKLISINIKIRSEMIFFSKIMTENCFFSWKKYIGITMGFRISKLMGNRHIYRVKLFLEVSGHSFITSLKEKVCQWAGPMVASCKTLLLSDMTLPESMTLTEILPTANFSVKLMHDCILGKV